EKKSTSVFCGAIEASTVPALTPFAVPEVSFCSVSWVTATLCAVSVNAPALALPLLSTKPSTTTASTSPAVTLTLSTSSVPGPRSSTQPICCCWPPASLQSVRTYIPRSALAEGCSVSSSTPVFAAVIWKATSGAPPPTQPPLWLL